MPKPRQDPKSTALKNDAVLNPHPDAVTDALFQSNAFFDARDLVQVKYEMLRRARAEGMPKADAAQAFGVSRPTFYLAERALAEQGLAGLLPRKRGPKQAHKLAGKVLAYVEQLLAKDASLRAPALATLLAQRFAMQVHPRSIERALARKKKRRQPRP
jgi:transposase